MSERVSLSNGEDQNLALKNPYQKPTAWRSQCDDRKRNEVAVLRLLHFVAGDTFAKIHSRILGADK
jgi:hypothetical protein